MENYEGIEEGSEGAEHFSDAADDLSSSLSFEEGMSAVNLLRSEKSIRSVGLEKRQSERASLTLRASVPTPRLPSKVGGKLEPISIVLMVVGTRGDVQPFIGIALKLKEYGHRVRLASHKVGLLIKLRVCHSANFTVPTHAAFPT